MLPNATFLVREDFWGHWWDVYRGPSGRLVAVSDELNLTVEGEERSDLAASALDAITMLREAEDNYA